MQTPQVPYAHQLHQIRALAETVYDDPNFPANYCGTMGKTTVLVRKELRRVAGFFITDDGKEHGHIWCYDPKRGLYIDLTADQFDRTLPKVLITKVGDPRYRPSVRMTWRVRMPTPIISLLFRDLDSSSIVRSCFATN